MPFQMNLISARNIADLQRIARRRLPRLLYDFIEGGADDETTLANNRRAFEKFEWLPRLLAGNGAPDLSTVFFGRRSTLPFLIGPTGLNGALWHNGDIALARAAAAEGAPFVLSSASTTSMEDVAAACPDGDLWFQLYPWGGLSMAERMLHRARKAGYRVLIITLDSLVNGNRERDRANGFERTLRWTPRTILDGLSHPSWLCDTWLRGGGSPRLANLLEFVRPGATSLELVRFVGTQRDARVSWDDIARLRQSWTGPMLIKGLLAAHDVSLAAGLGVDGIVVSNHGGRQLDGAVATLNVLPEILAASDGKLKILIDGGFRRGTDIAKAFSLGAHGVLLGRATLYGLAASGERGVSKALEILRAELKLTLQLLGADSIAGLSPALLRQTQ